MFLIEFFECDHVAVVLLVVFVDIGSQFADVFLKILEGGVEFGGRGRKVR